MLQNQILHSCIQQVMVYCMVFYTVRFHHISNCWLLYTFQTCGNINNCKTDNPFHLCLLIFATNVTDISPFCLHNQGSEWQNASFCMILCQKMPKSRIYFMLFARKVVIFYDFPNVTYSYVYSNLSLQFTTAA